MRWFVFTHDFIKLSIGKTELILMESCPPDFDNQGSFLKLVICPFCSFGFVLLDNKTIENVAIKMSQRGSIFLEMEVKSCPPGSHNKGSF